MDKSQALNLITEALSRTAAERNPLHIARIGERTIAARIAMYLDQLVQEFDPELNADSEYNIMSENQSKRLDADEQLAEAAKKARRKVIEDTYVVIVPDIIVHRRNDDLKNRLVLEIKLRKSPKNEIDYAVQKLRVFKTPPFSYSYAILVSLPNTWQEFANSAKIDFV